ncbi:MAG: pilus assembly protein PilO [Candidatus Tectimicrobiota bacterium]|nr:MAG: pilus assembly protein PilO [Candidatus Tectomicrobia bacterium]
MQALLARLEAIPSLYRWLMIPALWLVVAAGYYYVVYLPNAEAIARLREQIAAKEQTLRKHQKIAAKYDAFKAKVAELDAELRRALLQLPESKEIPDLIRQISDLGVQTGLEISLLRPQAEQQKTFYAEVPITVKVVGPYHAVGQFFDALARLPRIVSVSNVRMNAQTRETECLAVTYRFLEEEEKPNAAAARR